MNLTYVPAKESDIEPLFQLSKDLIDRYENTAQINYPKVLSWVLNKIKKNINEYTCIFEIVKKSGTTVFILLIKIELDDIYVFSPYQNQGIGSEVIRKCIAETGLSIFLYVFIQNTKAVSLYKS